MISHGSLGSMFVIIFLFHVFHESLNTTVSGCNVVFVIVVG